jgi:hypothetical protein
MILEKSENYLDLNLLDKISSGNNVFWGGVNPPLPWFISTSQILDNEKDHRLPNHFHQSFEIVYLLEINLGDYKNWQLIIDESLRLLSPGGLLFLRMTDTPLLSIFELKNFINMWGKFTVYFDNAFNDGNRILGFENLMTKKRTCEHKTFSFGVITNGNKLENLKSFIDSILKIMLDEFEQIEIIVCGPKNIENEIKNYCSSIKFINEPDKFKSIGWITKKKNMIVEASEYENLIIAHDRYIFPTDFIKNFKNFGQDYSVIVCKQELENKTRIPDWVTIGSEWGWTTPGILEYGDWSHYNFINGGIIIAKRNVLKKSPWNELLFWNQAEDVELTRTLKQNGFVPRLARNILVYSLPMRKNFMEGFEYIPYIKNKHVVPGSNFINPDHINHLVEINEQINFNQEHQTLLPYKGIYIEKSWLFKNEGIALESKKTGFISFVLKSKPPLNSTLSVTVSNANQIEYISINEIRIKITIITEEKIEIPISEEAVNFNNIIRLRIANTHEELILKNIILKQPEQIIVTRTIKSIIEGILTRINKSKRSIIIKTLAILLAIILVPLYLTLKISYKYLKNIKNKIKPRIKHFESKYFHS